MPSQSPALPSYSKLDGQAPATHRRSPSKLAWQTRTQAAIRRPVVLVSAFAACLVVYILVQRPGAERALPASSQSRTGDGWHDSLDRLTASWRATPRPPTELEQKEACNPFEANGRLTVDLDDPRDTVWTPYDRECEPSNLMTALYRPPGDTAPLIPPAALSGSKHNRAFLPWFRNRTVVLHGDSIDRYHLKDFCSFVGGMLTNIDPHHPASPPMWVEPKGDSKRREMEQKWRDRPKEGWELTNPWVCDIEEYGTTLVSIFTWGLAGAEQFFEMERWYHPPGAPDRIRLLFVRELNSSRQSTMDGAHGRDHRAAAARSCGSSGPTADHAPGPRDSQLGLLGPSQIHRGCVYNFLCCMVSRCMAY